MERSIAEGATPKDTMSASESNSLPIGFSCLVTLATSPSKKSAIVARVIKKKLVKNFELIIAFRASIPNDKFINVTRLGRLKRIRTPPLVWVIDFLLG